MKLSKILGRILTDVALRQKYPDLGVCHLVDMLGDYDCGVSDSFEDARRACAQTNTFVYPVAPADGSKDKHIASTAWSRGNHSKNMWRGQYGINRRKLVRDCWRWAKERGL